MNTDFGWNFDNTYIRLPELLYVSQKPVPVRDPEMAVFNRKLSDTLGLDTTALQGEAGAAFFSGNWLPKKAQPIAMAYAGHQFGYFTMLGDGRAVLLGEHVTKNNERFDIQLKGSGRTPFSRNGDGRAALGPMLREYIISEAMHALGIPTSRSLAVVSTGEKVMRESVLPGAVLTRVASSHIRVGTFEYLARQGSARHIRTLADYTINRHYPELKGSENPYLSFFDALLERQAFLIAKWMSTGFIHGVMNTDNMALSGETIDYGPCAFMDVYDPSTVFSSIDHQGRYSLGNQPDIARWNLARFVETILSLLHQDPMEAVAMARNSVESFSEKFQDIWLDEMRGKLGLNNRSEDDSALIASLLTCMHHNNADYTNTFRDLALEKFPDEPIFRDPVFGKWHELWQKRLSSQHASLQESRQLMNMKNPAAIPRNHLVEEALHAAVDEGDFSKVERLMQDLSSPFQVPQHYDRYRVFHDPAVTAYRTFCGT